MRQITSWKIKQPQHHRQDIIFAASALNIRAYLQVRTLNITILIMLLRLIETNAYYP